MKALSLTQPWASLVVIGAKCYETRSWATNYRGPLAIHASKGFPVWAKQFAGSSPAVQAVAAWALSDIRTSARFRNWNGRTGRLPEN